MFVLDFVTAVSAAEEEEGERRERGRRTTVEALGERQSDSARYVAPPLLKSHAYQMLVSHFWHF